mmetsp:Transcript_12542/g.38328  ORF Transcript_12542/g.38328 Transcript_12542/m.38328 type:complete len:244 (+) Transcript_12542:256-987(+)
MMRMTFERSSPKSSSFRLSGVAVSSSSLMCLWILPISVVFPVPVTTAVQTPREMVLPEKSMLCLSCTTGLGVVIFATDLLTASDSPVTIDWSTEMTALWILTRRRSAGTFCPTRTLTMSPGTSSAALTVERRPLRTTSAFSGSYSFSALIAFSASFSCRTPTMALATRMSKITRGSKKAASWSSASSNMASTNDTRAAISRMMTSWSLNCANTSFQSGCPSSESISFHPCFSLSSFTLSSLKP